MTPAVSRADDDDRDLGLGRAGLEATLLTIGMNLTSTVATLLDQLSDAPTNLNGGPFPPWTPEETALLNKVGALLTDDVHVFTNGLNFNGKQMSLAGMRLVHSIREDNATRIEATPSLLSYDLRGPTPTFTFTTRQQHFWTNPITAKPLFQVRVTQVTCVRQNGTWLIKDERLQTTYGPYEITLPPFQSPYVR